MPQARKYQVAPEVTPYYHCISRCVRRAYLCGYDRLTERSFEHRRQWIVDRLKALAQAFAVDICAYAIMSNHFHLVVKIQCEQALEWSMDEVIDRWTQLFSTHETQTPTIHHENPDITRIQTPTIHHHENPDTHHP